MRKVLLGLSKFFAKGFIAGRWEIRFEWRF